MILIANGRSLSPRPPTTRVAHHDNNQTVPQATDETGRPARAVRCRYLTRFSDPCASEAVDPAGEILLCRRHLGLAMQLLRHHGLEIRGVAA